MQTDRFATISPSLRVLLLPHVLLTLVVAFVSYWIFKADLWVEDGGIVYSTASEIPRENWLPRQLWLMSYWFAFGEPWAYQFWNALTLLGTTLCVYRIMRIWLEQSYRVSPWLRSQVALLAGGLFALHPVAGMTACAVSHLDWQLATLFSLLSLLSARSLFQNPGYARLTLSLFLLGCATLSAPSGLLLSAASIWVSWQLTSRAERHRAIAWASVKQSGRPVALFLAGISVMGLAWFLHLIWSHHSQSTGLGWSTHILTQGQLFWTQFRGLMTPVDLLPSHTVAWSEHWTDWVAVAGLLMLTALVSVTVAALIRRPKDARRPLYAIVLLALWPSLLILGWRTPDAFSEVRWYAALPWAAMFAAWVVGWIVTRWNALKYPLGFSIPVFLAFTSLSHLSKFQDADQVIAMILSKEPQNMRMRCFAAELQAQRGQLTSVIKLSNPTEAAYRDIVSFNTANPQGRRYDLVSALRWWVEIENLVQQAIHKNYGAEYAQAYASNSTTKFSQEVRNIAEEQPEARPLLAQFPMPPAPVEAAKPRLATGIPGINTAVGKAGETGTPE